MEEALDLSFDILLMKMMMINKHLIYCTGFKKILKFHEIHPIVVRVPCEQTERRTDRQDKGNNPLVQPLGVSFPLF